MPPLMVRGCRIHQPYPLMVRGDVTPTNHAPPYGKGRWCVAPEGIRKFKKRDRQGFADAVFLKSLDKIPCTLYNNDIRRRCKIGNRLRG